MQIRSVLTLKEVDENDACGPISTERKVVLVVDKMAGMERAISPDFADEGKGSL